MENILNKNQGFKINESTGENKAFKTNLDTNFLKIIAIIAMVIDHCGKAFLPDAQIFTIIGRIAFPIFAYCMVVGVIHTSNFKKYLTRLGSFAIISQIPWVLAFNPTMDGFKENFMNLNIFFTLFFGAIFVYGMKEKNNISLIISIVAFSMFPLDYGFDVILLLASLYLLRDKKILSLVITAIILSVPHIGGTQLSLFGMNMDMQALSVLAIPFIYINTNKNLKINKYFFYAFYPMHLVLIFLVRLFLNI